MSANEVGTTGFQRIQYNYCKTFNIRRTSIGINIVDHSDVVGASPAGAEATKFLFST